MFIAEKILIEAKQLNSTIRMCGLVQLNKNRKSIAISVLFGVCLNYVDENDKVLIVDVCHSWHTGGNTPRARFTCVQFSGMLLLVLCRESTEKSHT